MGLDVVELIMAIEESFDISISNEEAGDLITVGDIHRLILSKSTVQDSKTCLTSAAFYRTRRALVETLGIARHDIRPATTLDIILPRGTRREHWKHLRDRMNLKFPNLRHTDSILWSLLGPGVAFTIALGYHLGLSGAWLAFFALPGLVTGALLIQFTSGLAVEFPNGTATVGDLSKQLLALNYARFSQQACGATKPDTWSALRRLIHDQTGVPLERITPTARIVADLRLD